MRSRALRYPLPAYTRYTHLPSLAVKISSARGGWVDPKLLLHAAFPITFVQPGIQEATRRKPASSVPKRSAEGDRKEKAKQERARERERERERERADLKPLKSGKVSLSRGLIYPQKLPPRYRFCNIDMQTSSRLAYRALIDFRNVFSAGRRQ